MNEGEIIERRLKELALRAYAKFSWNRRDKYA